MIGRGDNCGAFIPVIAAFPPVGTGTLVRPGGPKTVRPVLAVSMQNRARGLGCRLLRKARSEGAYRNEISNRRTIRRGRRRKIKQEPVGFCRETA